MRIKRNCLFPSLLILILANFGRLINSSKAKKDKNKNIKEQPIINITKWQYCEGCKLTAILYTEVLGKEMDKMQKLKITGGTTVDAFKLAKNLCDNDYFSVYQDYIKYSCIRILNQYAQPFIEAFVGSGSRSIMHESSERYERTKTVTFLNVFFLNKI
jgi:hypothetical protein